MIYFDTLIRQHNIFIIDKGVEDYEKEINKNKHSLDDNFCFMYKYSFFNHLPNDIFYDKKTPYITENFYLLKDEIFYLKFYVMKMSNQKTPKLKKITKEEYDNFENNIIEERDYIKTTIKHCLKGDKYLSELNIPDLYYLIIGIHHKDENSIKINFSYSDCSFNKKYLLSIMKKMKNNVIN